MQQSLKSSDHEKAISIMLAASALMPIDVAVAREWVMKHFEQFWRDYDSSRDAIQNYCAKIRVDLENQHRRGDMRGVLSAMANYAIVMLAIKNISSLASVWKSLNFVVGQNFDRKFAFLPDLIFVGFNAHDPLLSSRVWEPPLLASRLHWPQNHYACLSNVAESGDGLVDEQAVRTAVSGRIYKIILPLLKQLATEKRMQEAAALKTDTLECVGRFLSNRTAIDIANYDAK